MRDRKIDVIVGFKATEIFNFLNEKTLLFNTLLRNIKEFRNIRVTSSNIRKSGYFQKLIVRFDVVTTDKTFVCLALFSE